jgi:hypothetical protein
MYFPFILIALLLLNALVFVLVTKFILRRPIDFLFTRQRAISFFLQTLVSCYTLLISGAFSPLVCLQQNDGKQTLVRSPSIECHGSEWQMYYGSIVTFLVIYAAIFPLSFLGLLIFNRKAIRSAENRTQVSFMSPFTDQYKRRYFWWEVISLSRKALFVIITGLIPAFPSNSAPYFGCIFAVFFFLGMELFFEPFKQSLSAKGSSMWSVVIVLVLLADGLIFKSASIPSSTKTAFAVVMLIVIILALCTVLRMCINTDVLFNKCFKEISSGSDGLVGDVEIKSREMLKEAFSRPLEEVTNIPLEQVDRIVIISKKHMGPVFLPVSSATTQIPMSDVFVASASPRPSNAETSLEPERVSDAPRPNSNGIFGSED